MAFFNDLTTLLKQKWLQFFQDNRSWITLQMQVDAVYTPDGGRRPSSHFILGVVNALEPQLSELMLPFSQLNPDPDALVEVLELNFDPDLFLENLAGNQADILMAALTEVDSDQLEIADAVVLVDSDDAIIALTELELDELSESPAGMADEVILVDSALDPTELGNMTLDEIAEAMGMAELEEPLETPDAAQVNEEPPETPSAAQPDAQKDVSPDVWADTSSESNQADNQQSQHDKEISRLFPNS